MVDSVNTTDYYVVRPIKVCSGIGALAGVLAGGASETIKQKNILSHPDEFIKRVEEGTRRQQEIFTEVFKGSKEDAKIAFDKLEQQLQKAKDFAKGGKFNFGAIAKKALGIGAIGVLVAGLVAGLEGLLVKTIIDKDRELVARGDAKILAEEMNNVKSK